MNSTFKRGMSFVLAFMMVFGIFAMLPFTAFAANDYTINSTTSTDDYYNLISKKDWEIAPGITESQIVLNNDDGSQRQVLFVMEADLNNEYVKVINSYTGMVPQYGDYKTGVMSEQARLAEELGYGNVVGAMNTTLSWYTGYSSDRVGEPLGFIMLDAEILFDPANCGYVYGNVGFPSVLVINKDFDENGNPRPDDIPKVEMPQIRSAEDLHGWEDQVIPCSSGYIVKDGLNQYTPSHTGGAPRSVVGIKPDGSVVIMVNDGRQAPYSEGMSMYELAEVMLDLGCSFAVNCDGGGSTTWLSQRPGEELKVNNSPSDGAERETTTGILFISTAPATGEFVRANISSENDYYTPNSVVKFDAIGTDLVGTEADIPEDVIWQLADPSFGTIDNGIFTSNGKQGEVVVQMVCDGTVVGEDTIHIVMPDEIKFVQANMVIPFGKTVEIKINATYDSKPVVFNASDVKFELSNNIIGTISGLEFTAAPEGTEVDPAVLTATIGELTITANISLGRGTDIVYDFENQNLDGWSIYTNYPQYGPAGPNGSLKDPNGNYWYHGQNERGYISIVDATTGKVRNGNYALAVEVDFTQIYETGFHSLNMIFPKIDTTDAVSVGFWIYIPYDARYSDMTINSVLGEKFFADGSAMDFCEGWHYVKLNAPSAADGFRDISFSVDERASAKDKNGNPYYDHITSPNLNGKYTFYIDDISVDYSTAVEDRENPVFSTPMLMDTVGSVNAVVNGQTIKFNNPTFEVKVADFVADNATGLNVASAKAYIDGKEVACTFANGKISVNGVILTDGVHTVKFEIYDNAGNSSWVGGSVTVDAGKTPVVSVVPQNPNADRLLIGSLYWMDVVTTNIETIDKVELVFDMNNASSWELDGMIVAAGFTATYAVQADDNIATIIIERSGDVKATGSAVLVSFPVRTWTAQHTTYEGYEFATPTWLVNYGTIWAQSIELVLEKGVVTFVDGTEDTFGMKDILVDTELFFTNYTRKSVEGAQAWIDAKKAAKEGWHEHTAVALDDKAATCTETGYIGRTFCYECNSVIEWGTILPVADHEYEIVDGKLTCVVGGELFNGVYIDGKTYIDGVAVADGWNADHTAYYVNGIKLTGSHLIDGVMCTFDENGVYLPDFVHDGWYYVDNTVMYYVSNNYLAGYQKLDGKPYYFDENGMAYEGEYIIDGKTCLFDNGLFVSCEDATVIEAGWCGAPWNKAGLHAVEYMVYSDASIRITGKGDMMNAIEVGVVPWSAHVKTFLKTIFIGKDVTRLGNHAFRNCFVATSVVFEEGSKMNYIGARAFYNMRALKSIVLPDTVETLRAYAFGQTYGLKEVYLPASLTTIEENAFYAFKEELVLIVDKGSYAETYAQTHGISYINTVIELQNGVYAEDGAYYYYVDGVRTGAGLVKVDGYYYYASTGGVCKTGKYWVSRTNDLLPAGYYFFNEDGKMNISNTEVKNGVYAEDGAYYYYVDGVRTGAGLVKVDGYYYYASTGGVCKTGKYWVSRTNDLLPAGYYFFNEDGKMNISNTDVKNGVYAEDGGLYYYVDGVRTGAGLVEVNGDYYYASTGGACKTGKYWVSRPNDLMPAGYYTFDAETGKMII